MTPMVFKVSHYRMWEKIDRAWIPAWFYTLPTVRNARASMTADIRKSSS